MMMRIQRACALAISVISLSSFGLFGCGLVVPDIKEAWDADTPPDSQGRVIPGAGQIEYEVKQHVFCELGDAVKYVNKKFPVTIDNQPPKNPLPSNFIAHVSLSFQVDEASSLSPGVVLTTILPNAVTTFGPGTGGSVTTGQSRSVGFGGTLSSTGTRIDKFDPSYSVGYLMIANTPKSVCEDPKNDPFRKGLHWEPDTSSPFVIEGDLGIQKWLVGATIANTFLASETEVGSAGTGGGNKSAGGKNNVTGSKNASGRGGGGGGGGGTSPDTISYEIKFIIVSSGNVTPAWKLVQVSANMSGTFFSTGRTRTHDLIITIGPDDNRTLYSHLASEIGQAVSGSNGARLTPLQ
jgi:hypothetical protein